MQTLPVRCINSILISPNACHERDVTFGPSQKSIVATDLSHYNKPIRQELLPD